MSAARPIRVLSAPVGQARGLAFVMGKAEGTRAL